jgi:hypothetical protein
LASPEATLWFWIYWGRKAKSTDKGDTGKDVPYNVSKGDPALVVIVTTVSFVFVEGTMFASHLSLRMYPFSKQSHKSSKR